MGIKGKVDKMVVLACEECKERNYTTTKNKKTNKERLELNKYLRIQNHIVHNNISCIVVIRIITVFFDFL